MRRATSIAMATALLLATSATAGTKAKPERPPVGVDSYRDGHTRPRALAYGADDRLLYVALSTSDEVAIVDPAASPPRLLARARVCGFPDAIASVPGGGAVVACRFDPALRRIRRGARGEWRVRTLAAGSASGARGLALSPDGALAYVASPADGGVNVVSLAAGGGVVQTRATGLSPRALRVVPVGAIVGQDRPLLLVSNFIDHTVTVHRIGADGRLGEAVQTIKLEAPVLDLIVAGAPATLLLFTHEDRRIDRAHLSVEGLDSGVIVIRASARGGPAAAAPFDDPGPGKRTFVNLGERATPVIELAAAAGGDGGTGIAVVGAGSDNLLIARGAEGSTLAAASPVDVGANPSAVAALPGGRFVTADRLSDTLSFVADGRLVATLDVGVPERPTPAERGELLFYSRALVPNNVADGPLSLYTCAACHDDGDIDGRRHPAKRNRFFSMTKSCRGLGTTAPYLSLGEPATIEGFADNIVTTHAQGAERGEPGFDRYPVTLRVRAGRDARGRRRALLAGARRGRVGEPSEGSPDDWEKVTLSPDELRAALAAYMVRIPPEPSPFVRPGRRALERDARAGLALFRDGCAGCHQLVGDSANSDRIPGNRIERRLLAGEVALTDARLHAVGTPVLGNGGNNPPSLRGVWEAAPYFSDGSARTLEEVLRRTDPDAPQVHAPANATRPPAFSATQSAALLAFLRAL
ncbi:MAG TPA: c-type cytochrome [Polyangia bacterium]|nr:c-type cytochrome [Polyangia bacterium]